ncbi:MAG: hypothetical protein DWP95_13430 [Proteobacteria bacterium]|nr:MAG: hypothetical protein DWP95_13430 [Pseudomonadota bacterium]
MLVFITLQVFPFEPALQINTPQLIDSSVIEGQSFPGKIKARGLLGIFSVKGTLSFSNGQLHWHVKGTTDSGFYHLHQDNGIYRFTAHVINDDGTFVDWSGIYNGNSVQDVQAIWNRSKEQDFIHNLFLPDHVILIFKQNKD